MRRSLTLAMVVALLGAACAQQTPPERSAIPDIAPELVPDFVLATDPFDLGGATDSCELLVGTGVRVLRVSPGSPAEGVLVPGDVIVGIDGRSTTTAEALQQAVHGQPPGDTVELEVERDRANVQVEIVLMATPEDPQRGQIGAALESRLETSELDAPPELGLHPRLLRPMVLDDRLMLFDPLGAAWLSSPSELPVPRLGMLDGSLIVVVPGQATLVRFSDGATAHFELGAWEFLAAVGQLGDNVLVSAIIPAADPADPPVDSALLALDFEAESMAWAWDPGSDPIDQVFVVEDVFEDIDRARAVVSLRSGAVEGAQFFEFAMLDASGDELTGWGSEARGFVPTGSVVGGWYDAEHIVFLTRDEDGAQQAELLEPVSGTRSRLIGFDEDLAGLWAVGDGRHLLVHEQGRIALFDTDAGVATRPIFRGCAMTAIGNYGSFG